MKSTGTRKFILKASLFMAGLVVIMLLVEYAVTSGLRKTEEFWQKEWNEIRTGEAASEVLVSGSSRAFRDINPEILGDSVGMTAYNLGSDNFHTDNELTRYWFYREYNPKPKVIVHVMDFFSFEKKKNIYYPDQFLPYYDDTIIRKSFESYSPIRWYERLPGTRYVGNNRKVFVGFSEFLHIKHFTCEKVRGHAPLDLSWNDDFDKFIEGYPNGKYQAVDPELVREFDRYLAECKREGIKVYLVYAPEYKEVQPMIKDRKMIIDLFRLLALRNDCTYWDYSLDPISMTKDHFFNTQHLNKSGCMIFSRQLGSRLKSDLRR